MTITRAASRPRAADLGRQAVYVVEIERHHLDATFLEKFRELRNRLIAQSPVVSNRTGGVLGVAQVRNGVGRAAWLLPVHAAQVQQVLDRQIALQHVDRAGFEGRFLPGRRSRLLSEVHALQGDLVLGRADSPPSRRGRRRARSERATRHILVALIFADGLRGYHTAHGLGQAAEGHVRPRRARP